MKKNKYTKIFIIIFIITFFYTHNYIYLVDDEIWNYGFAYNISNNLIPYKDFNMVITPLYPYILSLFITIFGNHLYIMSILNSIIISTIIILMYKKINSTAFIIYLFLLLISIRGYNLFTVLISLLIILYVKSNNKHKDIVLGILTSFLFLTKQNIGIVFLIPLIIYSKSKKKFIIRIISFTIPIFLYTLYLIKTNSLYYFIDYCFLGLIDFQEKNPQNYLLFLWIPNTIYLIYILLKSKFKDEICMYTLAYQFIAYPIFNLDHIIPAFSLSLFYYIKTNKIKKKIKLKIPAAYYTAIITMTVLILIKICFHSNEYNNNKNSFLYGKLQGENIKIGLKNAENYINNNTELKDNNYNNLLIFSTYSYLIKLDMNIKINKYDLINNGNMGYKGEEKLIEEINNKCSKEKCIFMIDKKDKNYQLNKEIINYIEKNYTYIEKKDPFNIYISK